MTLLVMAVGCIATGCDTPALYEFYNASGREITVSCGPAHATARAGAWAKIIAFPYEHQTFRIRAAEQSWKYEQVQPVPSNHHRYLGWRVDHGSFPVPGLFWSSRYQVDENGRVRILKCKGIWPIKWFEKAPLSNEWDQPRGFPWIPEKEKADQPSSNSPPSSENSTPLQ